MKQKARSKIKGFTLHLLWGKRELNPRYREKGAGFSLIEMLVVIFIVGLISSTLVVNWRKNEKQYQLQRAVQEVIQNIRKAQDMALNSYKYDPSQSLPGNYGLYFTTNNRTYYKIFTDENGDGYYDSGEFLERIDFEEGIEIDRLYSKNNPSSVSNPRTNIYITFSLPDGFTTIKWRSGLGTVYSAIITIRRAGTTCPSKNCRNIVVEKTGRISIQ